MNFKPLFVLGIIASLSLSVESKQQTANQSKPNVLIVFVDDLGAMDIGSYGASFHETPNIDAFAKSAVRFSDAYSASPVCSPSRAALLTGKAPERVKITDWIPGAKLAENAPLVTPKILNELPLTETTLAETFKTNGYKTFFAGKWHLGDQGFFPDQHGFDVNIGGYHKGSPRSYYSPYKNPKLENGPDGEYLTDRLTNETLDFMKEQGDTPFFAMLSFYTVHTPLQAAKPYLSYYQQKAEALPALSVTTEKERNDTKTRLRQDNAKYASMVHAMDVNIGRLLKGMKDTGLDQNTIIVFTSDNGALSTLKRPGPASNKPFRAGKGWIYEGGIRVPMIIHAPGVAQQGTVSAEPVITTDIAPTLLELTGINKHQMTTLDGVSLVPVLTPKGKIGRKAVRVYYPHYHGSKSKPSYMVREGNWKLIYFYESGDTELYNLADDIGEQVNLANVNPKMAARMKSEMQQWLNSVEAEQPKLKNKK
ncbi:sulfatase [Thalassotalea fonticola]|uniref:Sulfatase n=1 Tax=Thalassotalea fonticola TaxID=3065649 RepID=A0ABZ0GLL5_9GAMM|nr:sulfatase [Colwelliaceae bacterium S1-1]